MYVCVLGPYTQPHSTQLGVVSVEAEEHFSVLDVCAVHLRSVQRSGQGGGHSALYS